MKVTRQVFEEFEKLYATAPVFKNGGLVKIFAGQEAQGKCVAIDPRDGSKKTVWDGENTGGTMTIWQLNEDGDIYANQRFFPIFHGPDCALCHGRETETGYDVTEVQIIPWLHRFDVLTLKSGEKVFLGATLAKFKENKDDWSNPGEILIGKVNEDPRVAMDLKAIKEGITKNHGYVQTTYNGKHVVLISGVEGLFCVYVPEKFDDEWKIEHLIKRELSDACVVDFDDDGVDEIVVIEGFHGNRITVNKLVDGEWVETFSKDCEFGHGLFGGKLLGKNRFIAGWRQGTKELIMFTKNGDTVEELVLGEGGTSQFNVWEDENAAYVLSADRQAIGQTGQLALYKITK